MNRNIFNRSGFSLIGFCRNKALRKVLATWCAFATLATTCAPAFAFSGDVLTDGGLGGATITATSAGVTVDTDLTDATLGGIGTGVGVVDWSALNVENSQSLTFDNGTWYNIVNSGDNATTIAGALNGNNAANVWIFNPAGIAINNGAVINVQGLFGAIAAGVGNTAAMVADPTTAISLGNVEGSVTIADGASVTAANNVFAGSQVEVGAANVSGATEIGVGKGISFDFVHGGVVSVSSAGTSDSASLMGAFANSLAVKAKKASVTVDGDLSTVGDFTVDGVDLAVEAGDLAVGGDLTVNSGAGKLVQNDGTVEVTGANGIVGSVTQNGENTAVTLSAAKISGDVTQKKGSMGIVKTAEVGGDYYMYGGELKSYTDNGNITINGELEQTLESAINVGTGSLVLKGGATQANKDDVGITAGTVELAGAGTETVNLLGNANEIGSIKGSADAVTIDNGETAVTVSDDLTVNSLTVAKLTQDGEGKTITSAAGNDLVIKGEVTQKAGTIAAASSQKVTIDGAFVQNQSDEKTAVLGDANNAVEITGDLTQTKGTITASTLTLDGAATQTEGAKVVATTAVALNATGKDVALNSSVNDIVKVTGTAGSVDVATTKGVTLDTLSTSGDTKVTANGGTDDQAISFAGINSADKYDLTGSTVGQAAGSTVTANEVALTASGAVTLDDTTGNAIAKVSGTAASVSVVTTTGLKVTDLDTGDGAMTFDAGANEVEFTGTAVAGTITLDSAAKQTSGSITAGKIDNSTTPVLFTQNGGTITTPEVTGAFTQNGGTLTSAAGTDLTVVGDVTQNNDGSIVAGKDLSFSGKVTQNGGTIAAADVTDPEDTTTFTVITFSDDVDQNYTHGKPAVIGQASQRNNVIFTKGFAQDAAGTEEGATAAPVLNANKVTFNQNIDDGINGTLNIKTIDGSGTVTLTPDEVGDDFTLSGNTTLKVKEVGDNFTQSGGTLLAKDTSAGIEFTGSFTQTGGTVGDSTFDVIVDGLLTQSAGSIFAKMLTLKSGATQTEGAVVSATTLTLGDGVTPAGAVSLGSTANLIKEVGGAADSLVLRTGELSAGAGLTVKNLTTTDNSSLTVKATDDSLLTLTFDGANSIATDDGKKLTIDAGAVGQEAGSSLKTTELDLPATVVTLTEGGNEIKKVSGDATSVTLTSKTDVEVNNLVLTESSSGAADNDLKIVAQDGTDMKTVNFTGTTTIGDKFDLTAGDVTQASGSKITANEVAVTVSKDLDSTGAVTLNESANAIQQVSGTAASVDIATTKTVTLSALDTKTTNDGNVTIVAKVGTTDQDIKFAGTNKANTYTLMGGKVVQLTGATVAADNVVLTASDDVTLEKANNAIQQVSGSAASVNLATTTDLTVAGLTTLDTDTDTIPDSGDIVLDAGATKTVTFTGANNVGTGDITVNNSAVDQTSGSITANNLNLNGAASSVAGTVTVATKITNANTLTQNGGTITTPEVTGAFVQTDGTIETADDATLTFGSTVHQNQGSGKTALIGKVDGSGVAKNDIVVTGSLTQDTGTIKAKSLTLKDDSTVKGTVDVIGKIDVAKTPSVKSLTQDSGTIKAGEIDGKFVLKDGSAKFTTITGDVVQDSNTKATAVLEAKTITGSVEQQSGNKGAIQALASGDNGGDGTLTIGTTTDQKTGNLGRIGRTDKSDELTLIGKLTQEQGSIYAKKLTLDGGATQTTVAAPGDEVATIDATTLVANNAAADIAAQSRVNKFGTLEGTGKDIKIVDSEGGLTIGALTANSLDAKVTGDVTGTSAISLAGGSSQNSKIDATGKIELKNATSELHNDGTAAAGYIDLDAADVIIEAKDVSLGAVSAKKNPSVGSASVTVSGDLVANGKVDVVAASADAITLKSTGGAVTLKDTVTTGSGNIKITGNTVTAETPADISNGTVGNIEIKAVTGNASLGGTVAAGQKLTVESTAGQVTFAKNITAGNDLTVTAGTDVTLSGNATSGAALSITADDNITTATGKALQGQTVAISADDNGDADGDPLVNGTGKADMKASIKATVGDVTVAGYDVEFADNVEANGDVTVTAANDVSDTASKTVSGKNVTLTATAGDATVNGTVVATTGKTSVKATTGDVTVAGTVKANAGDVDVTAGTDVSLTGTASLEANKKLTVEAGNDIADAAATTALSAKDLVLTADKDANNTGKVEIKGVVTATGTTTLSAAGDISLANAANDFTGTVTADNAANPATTPGNIALKDASDLKLGSVTAAGGVSAIAVDGLSVLDNATVSAANGDIVLTAGSGNNLSIGDSAIVSAAPGAGTTANMTLTAGNDVFIGDGASLSTTLASGGTATIAITADNKINLSDKPATTGLKASIAAGGDLTAHAKGGDITTAADTSITVGGALDADADNGAIAINGTIAVVGDADFTAKTTVTALNAGNDFDSDGSFGTDGKGKVSATATDVQLKEANDIVLGNITTTSANTGIKVETVDGDITVVGALKSQQPGTQNAASIKLTAKDANDDHTGGSIDVASTGSIISDTNVELLADEDASVAGDITASNGKVEITAEDGDASLTSASLTANNGDVKVEAKGAITVSGLSTGTGVADITASKAVSLKAGAGTGDVTIYTDGTIEAKNGGVTIENAVGDVEVGGATVNAKQATTAPVPLTDVNVIVKATTGDVKITKDTNNNGAALTAENKVEVLGNGQVKVDTPTSLTANKDYVKVIATTKDASVDGTVTAATYAQIEATADDASVGGTVTANDGDITVTAGKAIMIDGALTAKDGGTTGAGDIVVTANGNDTPAPLTSPVAVLITSAGSLTADKSVSITATDATAASAITIDTTGAVTAKDGSVTINNANGDVTIQTATVEAKKASSTSTATADVTIDATGDVTVDSATVTAADNVFVGDISGATPAKIGGAFYAKNGAKVTAEEQVGVYAGGDLKVTETSAVWAKGKTLAATDSTIDFDATGDIFVDGNGSGPATVQAGEFAYTLVGGQPVLTPATLGAAKKATINAGGSVTVQKNAGVGASGDVDIDAGADVVVDNGAIVWGNGEVTVDTAAGKIDVTKNAGVFSETDAITLTTVGGAISVKDNATVDGAKDVKLDSDTSITLGQATASKYAKVEGQNVTLEADEAVTVTGDAKVIADNSVTIKSTDTTGAASDITIDTTSVVQANDGSVAIENKNGAVTIKNGTVEAKLASSTSTAVANVDIDATGAVTVDGATVKAATGDVLVGDSTTPSGSFTAQTGAKVESGKNIKIYANNDVKVLDTSVVDANGGDVIADSKTAKIDVDGEVTASVNATLTAAGDITISKGTDATAGLVEAEGGKALVKSTTGNILVKETSQVKAQNDAEIEATAGSFRIQDTAQIHAGTTGAGNTTITALKTIDVDGGAIVDASKAVTITSTDTAAVSDIKIWTIGNVTAKDGSVTILNNSGAVDITGWTVEAKSAGATAKVDIDANGDVSIRGGSHVTADDNVEIDTVAGTGTGATPGDVKMDFATVTSKNGDVLVGSSTTPIAGKFSAANKTKIESTVGAVGIYATGDVDVTAGTPPAITVSSITSGADTTIVSGGDVTTAANTTLTVGNFTATPPTGDLSVTATGKVDLDGVVKVAGKTKITSGGIVDAANTANDFVGDVMVVSGTDVTLNDVNSITIADVTGTGANGITATGKVDIDGTAVTVNDAIVTDGSAGTGKDVTIDASTGDITINAAVSSTDGTGGAGDVKVTAAAGDVNINSADITADNDVSVVATAGDVTATATAPATANIVAGNDASVSAGGKATLNDVTGGRVASVNATGNVKVNDVNAGTGNANVSSFTGNVVANDVKSASNTAGVIAIAGDVTANDVSGTITTVTANGNATVNDVTATAGNANITATTGNITANDVSATVDATINANGNTTVNNVTATTGNAVVKATTGSANVTGTVAAGGQADVLAGTTANASFDSNVVNVEAGGSANVNVLAGGINNPSGNMTIDADTYTAAAGTSSVVAGGDLNLNVAGNLTTAGSAEIHAGGNLDVKAASASSPLNIDVGGSTIGIDLAGQAAVALNDHGKNYTVKGNDSHTAIFIDGRLAGGDPRYFSILSSYEGEVARGVVTGPLAVPYVSNIFAAPFITLDLPLAVPGILGQSYMQGEAGSIDAGDAFPEADTALAIPGLPANSTIFFIPRDEAKNKTAAL